MEENPTTEKRKPDVEARPETVKEPGLTEKLSQLRQKLGQKAKQEPKFRFYAADFLGYTFRYDRDLHGRGHRYLRVCPSKQALQRERDKLRERTGVRFCWQPLPALVVDLNRHLESWASYFSFGHARQAHRQIETYVRERLWRHLRRRSQRPFRPPTGVRTAAYLDRMGLVRLERPSAQLPAHA